VRLLHADGIDRHFDDAQLRRVASRRKAAFANLGLGEVVAAGTVMQVLQRRIEPSRQPIGTIAVALQQVIGHALRRLRADARQATQGLDQLSRLDASEPHHPNHRLQTRRLLIEITGHVHRHIAQNGSFIPGGRFSPARSRPSFPPSSLRRAGWRH
jgi:hypothetical protein